MASPRVAVVGAGLSGAACAQALRERGVVVEMFERGRAPGGRMASPSVQGRRVDVGAAYFTVKDPGFGAVADDWVERGLARPWTDTFDVLARDGRDATSGPVRYATPDGLRSLVRDLLPDGIRFETDVDALDDLDHDAVVLAMPDPQAARLAPDACAWVPYDPVIAVAVGWGQRCWSLADAAFVNDDPDVSFIADAGAATARPCSSHTPPRPAHGGTSTSPPTRSPRCRRRCAGCSTSPPSPYGRTCTAGRSPNPPTRTATPRSL